MTLKELLQEYKEKSPNTVLYIGSQSAWVWIGTASEIESRLPLLDVEYSIKRQDRNYTPFASRVIIERYHHYEEPVGTCVIISGHEQGKFWFAEEMETAKKGQKVLDD